MEGAMDKDATAPRDKHADDETSKKHKQRGEHSSGRGMEASVTDTGKSGADDSNTMQRSSKRSKGGHRRHRSSSSGHAEAGADPEVSARTSSPVGGPPPRDASSSTSKSASATAFPSGTDDRPPQEPRQVVSPPVVSPTVVSSTVVSPNVASPMVASPNPPLMLTPGGGTPVRKAGASASAMLSPFNAGMLSPQEPSKAPAEQAQQHPLATKTDGEVPTTAPAESTPVAADDRGGSQPDNGIVPVIAVTLVACAILVTVIVFKVLPTSTPVATKSYAVCDTAACVEYAERLSTTVNQSIDACHDFYSHVCSGWTHGESVNSDLRRRFAAEAVAALKSAAQATIAGVTQSAVQKAALLYQSCEKVYTEGQSELGRIRPMLKDVGVQWPNPNPNPDVLRTLLRLISKMALPVLFSAEEYGPGRDRNISVLQVHAVSRYLIKARRRRERNEASGKSKDYFKALFDVFNDKGSSTSVDYDTFQKLEEEGLAAFVPALEGANSSGELGYASPPTESGLDALATATPDISKQRWETQMREQNILASPSNATLAVSVRATAVLRALSGLVRARGEKDAELFVGWLVLHEVAPLVSKHFEVAGYVNAGLQEQRCLALAEMLLGWAALAPFAYSAISQATLPYIEALAKQPGSAGDIERTYCRARWFVFTQNVAVSIKRALYNGVTGSEWLRKLNVGELPNVTTGSFFQKMAEFEKLTDMDPAYIWMADMGDHLSDNWNRSGGPSESVVLSPSVFLTPAYVDGTGAAHRYGALGSLVAAHLFLLLTQTVRSTGGHDELSRRLACYAPARDHWTSGIEEAALGLAWQAYQSNAPEDARLKGMEQISGDQLFFVAFAYLHCASPAGQHSADRESRLVNSAVRNVHGFAQSFNCGPGVSMNPQAKCSYF
ncbi:hypothetical protein HPB50_006607 [Hyalomma asiaticum]|uniref:Uncharacterized protein n=1 Tax=Hyalomma asiaticum TaxID=266040 RepID=A0ACB7S7G1_HYAAI|nr:hypothetical protein HPB50_006607 [Hyalomma asiaticum]